MRKTVLFGLAGLIRGDCTTLEGTVIPGARKFAFS